MIGGHYTVLHEAGYEPVVVRGFFTEAYWRMHKAKSKALKALLAPVLENK